VADFIGALLIGLAGGIAGGLLGIGGGTVFVPALVLLLDVQQHTAQGVSLVAIIPTALSATHTNVRAGAVDRGLVLWIAPFAVVFGVLGAFAAGRIEGETLSRIFGAVLLYVGCSSLFREWRAARREAKAAR
jgi:uncharacterized membrane protein YfcA